MNIFDFTRCIDLYTFSGICSDLLFFGLELYNNIFKMHLDSIACGGFSFIVLQINYEENNKKIYIDLYDTNMREKEEKKKLKEYFFHKDKMKEILSLLP